MKKKGFTLIELLAVILILAILAAILSPIVRNIIENAREQADRRSAERYARAAQMYYAEAELDPNKADYLGTNILEQLNLEDIEATGSVIAYEDGTTEMAIVYHNKCYTKTTSQSVKNIEVSDDINNCTVSSTTAKVTSINSKEDSIDINVEIPDTTVSLVACKFGTNRNDLSSDGTVSGNTCTLAPTSAGTRYYYQLIFSDGTTRNGSIQGGAGVVAPTNPSNPGGGNGGSGSGGSGSGGVAAPVLTEANGRTVYQGTMVSPVQIKYFNVTTGTKCDIVDFSSNSSATSGCLKFFAYMEDNLSYTMIQDRTSNGGTYAWSPNTNSSTGPTIAYAKLKEITDSWQGTVTPKNYINVFMNNGAELAYRISYETDNAKARFITTDEIARITGNTSFDSVTTGTGGWFYLDGGTSASTGATWQTQIATASEPSAYAWLFNNTNGCTNYGCTGNGGPNGYWTSDCPAGQTTFAWYISKEGRLHYYADYGTSNSYTAGIRPVITVLKSALQ